MIVMIQSNKVADRNQSVVKPYEGIKMWKQSKCRLVIYSKKYKSLIVNDKPRRHSGLVKNNTRTAV